ncbi:MAG: ATP-binding protein [Deferrisomatales bacterium]|nr:ATP-binding protein [Deferrisomatales bacterium]
MGTMDSCGRPDPQAPLNPPSPGDQPVSRPPVPETTGVESWNSQCLDVLAVGIFQTDPHGNCVHVNPAWCGIAGLTEGQARGSGWVDALHPEDRGPVVQAWRAAVTGGGTFQAEYRFLHRSGSERWVIGTARALRAPDGEVRGYVGAITDISDRKHFESRHAATQDLLRRVLIHMPVMLVAFDTHRNILVWNRECERVTGYSAVEVQRNPAAFQWLATAPGTGDQLRGQWCGNGADFRDRLLHLTDKTGAERFVSWSNLSHTFSIPGWASWGVGTDVSALRASQDALARTSRDLAERVKELRCLYAISTILNRATPTNLPTVLQEVVGLIPGGFRFTEECCARITLPGAVATSHGFQETPWRLQAAIPVSGRQVVGTVDAYYRDHRSGKQDGLFLREEQYLLDEIASRIGEAEERRAAREELEEARYSAEAGVKLRNELLANVSHELRTPMNSILGYTELLLDGVDGPLQAEQAESLRRVDRNARRLLHLINDLLDLSTLQCDRVHLAAEAFSIREVVAELVRDLRGRVQDKGLHMDYHVAAEVPDFLVGDELRLRQVFGNLLDNAVKFTDRGQVSCRVATTGEEPGTVRLHVQVKDTGEGVPASRHASIFEPFVQGDGTVTREHGGSGLGLAICRHLVEMMGGEIWVESEEGRGSTFHVAVGLACLPE